MTSMTIRAKAGLAGRRSLRALVLGTAFACLLAAPLAQAQEWKAAVASGQVGEKPDGYLGVVGGGSGSLQAMVDQVNIQRKALYTQKAQANHVTVAEYAMSIGCQQIGQTKPGEKYQAPDGSWQTRGAGAPVRDSRCP